MNVHEGRRKRRRTPLKPTRKEWGGKGECEARQQSWKQPPALLPFKTLERKGEIKMDKQYSVEELNTILSSKQFEKYCDENDSLIELKIDEVAGVICDFLKGKEMKK